MVEGGLGWLHRMWAFGCGMSGVGCVEWGAWSGMRGVGYEGSGAKERAKARDSRNSRGQHVGSMAALRTVVLCGSVEEGISAQMEIQ